MHPILAGILAGLLHVVSGPDHLVAVAPLAMKRPLSGLRIGTLWGIGHASGVILVGMLGVLLRSFLHVETLSRWAEFVVGFVLIGVGLWAIHQMKKVVLHRHPHTHEERAATPEPHSADASVAPHAQHHPHAHLHVHTVEGEAHNQRSHQSHHGRGSFLVGLVHGAAGTGHLLGVLPSLALPPIAGAMYLGSYGVAAVVAMGLFGTVMGLIGYRLQPHVLRSAMLGCGMLAIGVGIFWLWSAWQRL